MTKGDVVSDIQNITTSNYLTFQPAAGVEVVIKSYGSTSGIDDVSSVCANGSLFTYIKHNTFEVIDFFWGVTNTNYFRLRNNNGETVQLSFTGVQIK